MRASLAGAVHVFEQGADGAWNHESKLVGSDTETADEFGYAVTISDDALFVGAPSADLEGQDEGLVYIFQRGADGQWSESARLTAPDPRVNAEFGRYIVSVDGRLIVAAPRYYPAEYPTEAEGGAAYVFEPAGDGAWAAAGMMLPAEERPPSAGNRIRYWTSFDAEGERAVAGAPGLAYVFERDSDGSWSQAAVLTPPNLGEEDRFGAKVALAGNVVVVGAPGTEEYAGAAHVFERQADGSWRHTDRLTAPNPVIRGWFGNAVAASGSRLMVQAMTDAVGDSTGMGGTYIYGRGEDASWALLQRLDPADYPELSMFQGSLLATEGRLIADGGDAEGDEGVYIFDGPGATDGS